MPPFIESVVNKALRFIELRINAAADKIAGAVEKSKKSDTSARDIAIAIAKVEKAVDKIKDPKFTGDVTIDTSAMEHAVTGAMAEVKKLSMPKLGYVEDALKAIYQCLEKKIPEQTAALEKRLSAIEDALRGFSVPSTITLDQMQFRALSNSRGSSMPMNPGTPIATRVENTTVTVASTSTEYSYTFPAATVAWVIKLRAQNALSYYAWTTGKLPSSGSGTTYMTIPQNYLHSKDHMDYSGKTIYLGAAATGTFEIEVFRQ